eukprot:c478_g1_i1.p1 GENE.c478_g1_i1~~c478_g1_i1.p1  ORF type:complete len:295 (-),score=54.33 c478_g1_i1:65-895(-)
MNDRLIGQHVELSISPSATAPRTLIVELLKKTDQTIDECAERVAVVKSLHEQAIHMSSNPDTVKAKRQEVDHKTQEAKDSISRAHAALKELSETLSDQPDETSRRVFDTQMYSKKEKLKGVVKNFQEIQVAYKGEYRGKMKRQYKSANPAGEEPTDDQLDDMIKSGQTAFSKSLEQNSKLVEMHREIEEEVKEIFAIEQSVMELAQMFQELNAIIVSQGALIDSIEGNLGNALDHVEKGTKQLGEANQSQQTSRKLQCCLIILLLIVALLILGIFF